MHLKKLGTLAAAAVVGAGMLMSAAQSASAEEVEITVAHPYGKIFRPIHQAIIKEFNKVHPDIKVKLEAPYPDYEEVAQRTLVGVTQKNAPTVSFQGINQIRQFVDAGYAYDLSGFKAADPRWQDKDGYYPSMMELGVFNGKQYAVPFAVSTPIMYINTEAFEKAGVEPPKTWEEFEEIAPALKDAGYVPLVQSQLTWEMTENFFSRNNLQFATNNNGYDSVEGTEILVNTPEHVMMYEKLKDWYDNGYFGYYGAGWSDNQKPFEENKVALWIGSSGSFGGLQSTAQMPFSATFLPYWGSIDGAGTNSFIGGAALFALSGKSDDENKCTADFFQFLTSPEIQYFYHKSTGYVPVTTAAYELAKEDGWYEEQPVAEVGIQQLSLPGGEWSKGYRMGFYPQIREVMEREYNKIFAGETSVQDAMATIEQEGNALLARFAKTAGN